MAPLRYALLQNLIPSFPWIGPGWTAKGRNQKKARDHIWQRSIAERSGAIVLQAQRAKCLQSTNLAISIWQPWLLRSTVTVTTVRVELVTETVIK